MPTATLSAPTCADPRDHDRLDELLRRCGMPSFWTTWRDHRRDALRAQAESVGYAERLQGLTPEQADREFATITSGDASRTITQREHLLAERDRLNVEAETYGNCWEQLAEQFCELRELVKAIAPTLLPELPRLPQADTIDHIDLAQAADQVGRVADQLPALEPQTTAAVNAIQAATVEHIAEPDGPLPPSGFCIREQVLDDLTKQELGILTALRQGDGRCNLAGLAKSVVSQSSDDPGEAIKQSFKRLNRKLVNIGATIRTEKGFVLLANLDDGGQIWGQK